MIDQLVSRIAELNCPICVGLDPQVEFIPEHILEHYYKHEGKTLVAVALAFQDFCCRIIDAVADIVPAVKPQIGMFERYGSIGVTAYDVVCEYAKKKGLIVIGDIKRGDISSTAEGYAEGHLGWSDITDEENQPWHEDIVTLNPYMGSDSVMPFAKVAARCDKGIFVLVKTSNPASGELQDLEIDGKPIYEIVGGLVSKWGEEYIGKSGFSRVAAVVGATYPKQAARLREQMPHTFFLVPGYGAQGATATDIVASFNENNQGAIVNSSRGIIAAYKKPKYSHLPFNEAARAAAIDTRDDILKALNSR